MTKPICVRELTAEEREQLKAGLRSTDTFLLRRCQILLASERGDHAISIARTVGCDDETVRYVIKGFNARGLAVLQPGSRRPHTIAKAFPDETAGQLKDLLHHTPRHYGKATSLWTLKLAAEVSFAEGLTAEWVSDETIRATLNRLGIGWKRAKQWITSPDPDYQRKKKRRDRLIQTVMGHPDWAVGFEDEVWWSRFAQPQAHTWAEDGQALRLVEQVKAKDDPDPKALACYGLLLRWWPHAELAHEKALLRFVDGRPVSALSTQYLEWACQQIAVIGLKVLVLVWDNASWHVSHSVRAWVHEHNRQVKKSGQGVRILLCYLPIKSPWLNPIEPKWVHGKRKVLEPDRTLSAQELAERVCAVFECEHEPHLALPQPENVS